MLGRSVSFTEVAQDKRRLGEHRATAAASSVSSPQRIPAQPLRDSVRLGRPLKSRGLKSRLSCLMQT